jgi:hypothetical protein
MDLQQMINQMGGLQQIAGELGISSEQAASGAAALLPAILGGFKQQARAQPGGLEDLVGILGGLGGGGLLDDVLSPQPTNVGRGNDVLGQIFGSKDVSRTVARGASARSGLDPALLTKMLPMLAMLVGGFLSQRGAAAAPRAGAMPAAQHAAGHGAFGELASMLDLNGDGNPLDDIMNVAGQLMR